MFPSRKRFSPLVLPVLFVWIFWFSCSTTPPPAVPSNESIEPAIDAKGEPKRPAEDDPPPVVGSPPAGETESAKKNASTDGVGVPGDTENDVETAPIAAEGRLAEVPLVPSTTRRTGIAAVPERTPEKPIWRLGMRGPEISRDGGLTWVDRGSSLPRRRIWPFRYDESLRFTALAADPDNPLRVVVTTSRELFETVNGGASWFRLTLDDAAKGSEYITSVSLDSRSPLNIVVGTSFGGVYESRDGGYRWTRHADGVLRYMGAGFYEHVADVITDPSGSGRLWVLYAQGKGLVEASPDRRYWREVPLPRGGVWTALRFDAEGADSRALVLESSVGDRSAVPGQWNWKVVPRRVPASAERRSGGYTDRMERARDKKGLYLNSYQSAEPRLSRHLDFAVRNGLNSVVFDAKDDEGRLTYSSELTRAVEIGAVDVRVDLAGLIKKAHARDLYVIARVVVFKDRRLYHADGGRLALRDKRTGEPWGYQVEETLADGTTRNIQKEFWVDPFSEEVWRYNVDVAVELQKLGVDEIQFDYIRFPSDGPTWAITSAHRVGTMNRVDALESFLRMGRREITLPISTDLYGFNSWYPMGNWIGQDIEMLANYVDVVCPMFYPSHFTRSFYAEVPYIERAELIYREGTRRARAIVDDRVLVRPYVQAFLLSGEFWMEEPQYVEYLHRQLRGLREGDGSGYTLWNNSGRYYMVTEPLEASY